MTDFYVYVHRKATTGEIFYVGKGTGYRAYEFGRNRHWDNTVKKHGYTVETVETGLQEWYALELEINLIAYHGRKDLGLGKLVNMTDGGDGTSGRKLTEEAKNTLRSYMMGKTINMGHTHSEATKKKMSESHTGKTISPEHIAKLTASHKSKPLSDEHKRRISESIKTDKVACAECGISANTGSMSWHQKCSGHTGVIK